jgi:hypothetical protein
MLLSHNYFIFFYQIIPAANKHKRDAIAQYFDFE